MSAMPARDEWVDAAFVLALTGVALLGFHQAFGGSSYLVHGIAGAAVGLVVAYATTRLRQPTVAVALAAVLAAVLLGGLVLPGTTVARALPTPATARTLGRVAIGGWKQLLTTVRPVGDSGDLTALPYLLGVGAATAAASLARRVRATAAALAPAAVVASLGILFGSAHPAAAAAQGAGLACLGLAWMAVRRARGGTSLVRTRKVFRPVAAVVVLALAGLGAWAVGPVLPLATARPRTILEVEPPFDAGAYPSPLAGFRKYTKGGLEQSLSDRTLFTVHGLRPGQPLRIATLDSYDGLAWGVANAASPTTTIAGFARVGSALPGEPGAPRQHVRIVVGEGYSDVWAPTVGVARTIEFGGPRASGIAASWRYNAATRTAVVPVGLRPGDVIDLDVAASEALTPSRMEDLQPEGAPSISPAEYEFLASAATIRSGSADTPVRRVLAIAETLRKGAYSDGRDQVTSDPGHGSGRIDTFVGGEQLVGDDEQYAAAMALMANAVGVPARVVLEASAGADGVVKGVNVQASVELALAGHGWVRLGTDAFTPPRTKKPDKQTKQVLPKVPPKVVPPPDRRTPAEASSSNDAPAAGGKQGTRHGGAWVLRALATAARWGGPPLLATATPICLVLALKARRRRRRRTHGPGTTRVAMGWAEVLDAVRDLGVRVPAGTRREQAAALGALPVASLADRADEVVFGPGEPSEDDVAGYWVAVDSTRRDLVAELTRRRRIRAALSLRSLLPGHDGAARSGVSLPVEVTA